MRCTLLLLIFTLVLHGAAIARADDVDSRAEYIVNGQPVSPDGVRGTVRVTFVDPDAELDEITPIALHSFPYCSGVLIAPSVVLTAAHCMEDCGWKSCPSPDGEMLECFRCEAELRSASSIFVTPGVRIIDDLRRAEPVAVREAIVPDDYTSYLDWNIYGGQCEPYGDDDFLCTEPGLSSDATDVAVLLLAEPITNLTPMPLLRNAQGIEGTLGTATGYGDRTVDGGELLDQDEYHSTLHETATEIEWLTENEILTGAGENQSGTCFGDSGGPLYVQRGANLFVAGVLSRFRYDREPPRCGKGSIYASMAAHASWIYEKAPEAAAVQFDRGGGCSASSEPSTGPGLWLVGMLLLPLWMRRRRTTGSRAPAATLLGVAAVVSAGCGSSGEASFCTESYDPLGVACDPAVERADLYTAEAVARSEVPDDAWLWQVRSSYAHVDPDGNAADWTLTYYLRGEADPPAGKALRVHVRGTDVEQVLGPEEIELFCVPTRPIEPFDSRRIIHDAIHRIENTGVSVQIREAGDLGLVQNHRCASPSLRLNAATYRVANGFYRVGYDEYGQFLEVRTPAQD